MQTIAFPALARSRLQDGFALGPDCAEGNAPIAQSFTAAGAGSYAVEITAPSGCVDTRDCVTVPLTAVTESPLAGIQVFPNPSDGEIQIDFGSLRQSFHLQVYNATGQLLLERHEVRDPQTHLVLEGPAGSYFLRIEDEHGYSRTLVRLKRSN